MNTAIDPEAYKQDLDTQWKKLLCLTVPGTLLLMMARKLKLRNAIFPDVHTGPLTIPKDPTLLRQLSSERSAAGFALCLVGVASYLSWRSVLFGYVLPFMIVTPIASMFRLILEHAESDQANVFHCGTFYQTGLISGPLFFRGTSDCHVVHHIYPAIPFYRMHKAVRLISPIILRHGARGRRSFVGLLYGFFVRNEAHRTVWTQ